MIIPARAGFTNRKEETMDAETDHPRSRGVYGGPLPAGHGHAGSSPLARGLHLLVLTRDGGERIIPARAGFTEPRHVDPTGGEDHPRSRGVYAARGTRSCATTGSSPLARGLRPRRPAQPHGGGIIPARAGFTARGRSASRASQDHPRSRGVYAYRLGPASPRRGSSPLARGLHQEADRRGELVGIIPARAGFTRQLLGVGGRAGDHPRSRGVYVASWSYDEDAVGSSPLARGLRGCDGRADRLPQDHPRSRGVYPRTRSRQPRATGSSPLARGLPGVGQVRETGQRIIPARAGFTKEVSSGFALAEDHPRSRGVYSAQPSSPRRRAGSSPLARGLPDRGRGRAQVDGIIPARAGFTRWRGSGRGRRAGSSPLARGLPRPGPGSGRIPGSSPLARGLQGLRRRRVREGRIIPARAGFTPCGRPRPSTPKDHPRSRGVYAAGAMIAGAAAGSSPLARGLLSKPTGYWAWRGIIPARAGFTSHLSGSASTAKDHPRSRGVYVPKGDVNQGEGGSSPLARGLPAPSHRHGAASGIIPARAGFTS